MKIRKGTTVRVATTNGGLITGELLADYIPSYAVELRVRSAEVVIPGWRIARVQEHRGGEFIVVRHTGRHQHDYLLSLNDEWGTVCGGRASGALRFPTRTAARAAARKARRACMGWNGRHPVRARIRFEAVEVLA